MSCDIQHTGKIDKVFCQQVPSISSDVIECDIVRFTEWLGQLRDSVNKNCAVNVELVNKVNELNDRMECVEARLDDIDQQLTTINNTLNDYGDRLEFLEEQLGGINNIFNQVNARVDWIYNKLPMAYGVIPDDFKFAMGNINHMSANNGTPSLRIGIFTSNQIEDNDVYSN